jgi:hypothetical protein
MEEEFPTEIMTCFTSIALEIEKVSLSFRFEN